MRIKSRLDVNHSSITLWDDTNPISVTDKDIFEYTQKTV